MLNLIENQIIYSNLKEDTYCNDNLAFILEVLKSIKYRGEKLTIIKKNNKINKSI